MTDAPHPMGPQTGNAACGAARGAGIRAGPNAHTVSRGPSCASGWTTWSGGCAEGVSMGEASPSSRNKVRPGTVRAGIERGTAYAVP